MYIYITSNSTYKMCEAKFIAAVGNVVALLPDFWWPKNARILVMIDCYWKAKHPYVYIYRERERYGCGWGAWECWSIFYRL